MTIKQAFEEILEKFGKEAANIGANDPKAGLIHQELLLQELDKAAQALLALMEAERAEGASIAAQEINRELGLDMTTRGVYYLLRHKEAA